MLKLNKKYFFGLFASLLVVFVIPFVAYGSSNDELKAELEAEIARKQEEIQEHQNNIQTTKQKAVSLNNEIDILENEIDKYRAEISQIDLVIQKSSLNIGELDSQIAGFEEEMNKKKELLSEYIRVIAQNDQETLLEVVLKNDKFSDFFNTINVLEGVQIEIHTVLENIQNIKDNLLEQRETIDEERKEQNQLKALQLLQKQSIEDKQWQKEYILKQTKGEESAYQKLIQNTENEIAQIKEQLSLLDKYNLSLNDAVQYAIYAGAKTGLRPAFLLGVLEAESRLGLNVGKGNWNDDMYQCYRDLGKITRASREKDAFFQICEGLGLNPDLQPVSAEPWYGCGGAIGIAQFMPTTWMAYKDRVAALTGNNPPSPWNPKDAFMAAAIKLSDAGANQKTEIAERTAYAKYLGGSRYQKWVWHQVTTYVINLAAKFQSQYFQ